MVAWVGLLMPVIGWSWTKDPQAAGHDQGAVGVGGHAPVGVQIHAPRVPKTANRSSSPTSGGLDLIDSETSLGITASGLTQARRPSGSRSTDTPVGGEGAP